MFSGEVARTREPVRGDRPPHARGYAHPVIPSTSLLSTQRSGTKGLASLLIVISGDTVRVLTLARIPGSDTEDDIATRCLVRALNAATDVLALGNLVYGAEPGRFWEEYPDRFNPEGARGSCASRQSHRVPLTACGRRLGRRRGAGPARSGDVCRPQCPISWPSPKSKVFGYPPGEVDANRPALFLRPERLAPAARGRGPRGPAPGEPARWGPNSGTGRSGSPMISAAASLGSGLAWAATACRRWPPLGPPTRCAAGPGASWHGRGRIRDVAGDAPPGCGRSSRLSCGGYRRILRRGTTIARILEAHRQTFQAHWGAMAGADVFTTEVWTATGLVAYYTLCVLDLSSLRGQTLGSTPHPNALFMPQLARTLVFADHGSLVQHLVLICDRDARWRKRCARAPRGGRVKWSLLCRGGHKRDHFRAPGRPDAVPGAERKCTRRAVLPVDQGGVSRPAGATRRAARPTGGRGLHRPLCRRTPPSRTRQQAVAPGYPSAPHRPHPVPAATGRAPQLLRAGGLSRRPVDGTLRVWIQEHHQALRSTPKG